MTDDADAGRTIALRATGLIGRAPNLIAILFVAAMGVLAIGVTSVKTSVSVPSLFRTNSGLIKTYRQMESRLGPLAPVEIAIDFGAGCGLAPLEQIQVVQACHVRVATMDETGGTISAATFFPPIPRGRSLRAAGRRGVLSDTLTAELHRFVDVGFVAEVDDAVAWRIGTRVTAIGDFDRGDFLNRLRDHLETVVNEHEQENIRVIVTGPMPVAYQAQQALLRSLFLSYLTAFTLIAIVMIALMRRLWAGLLAMLPNMFPTCLLFGAMGWLEIPVDIGSVMTSSVALGIAVDDTLHFLVWYRRQSASGADTKTAVRESFCHCGRAMTHTSLILSAGLLMFVFSDFVPTTRFAGMMIALLLAALVGDLILLPALLLGRLGSVFRSDHW